MTPEEAKKQAEFIWGANNINKVLDFRSHNDQPGKRVFDVRLHYAIEVEIGGVVAFTTAKHGLDITGEPTCHDMCMEQYRRLIQQHVQAPPEIPKVPNDHHARLDLFLRVLMDHVPLRELELMLNDHQAKLITLAKFADSQLPLALFVREQSDLILGPRSES